MKLYFAYGANTNFRSMGTRCPSATYVSNVTLHHFKLVFRGVADLAPSRGGRVQGAMWLITPECEASLDKFEGFPRLYVKRYVTMRLNGKRYRVMFYVMRNAQYQDEPSKNYEACLREGYDECCLPAAQLDNAISRAIAWRAAHVNERGYTGSWSKSKPKQAAPAPKLDDDAAANEAAAEAIVADFYNRHLGE